MSKQIIDIGIAESSRVEIADGLSRLLADTYTANSTPKCNTRQIKQPVVVHQTRSAVA